MESLGRGLSEQRPNTISFNTLLRSFADARVPNGEAVMASALGVKAVDVDI